MNARMQIEYDKTIKRRKQHIISLIERLQEIDAEDNQEFVEDLLVRFQLLLNALYDDLNSTTREILVEIYAQVCEIFEKVEAKKLKHQTESLANIYSVASEAIMAAKWTVNAFRTNPKLPHNQD